MNMSKITKTMITVLVSVLLGAGIMLVPGLPQAVRWGVLLGVVTGSRWISKALWEGTGN